MVLMGPSLAGQHWVCFIFPLFSSLLFIYTFFKIAVSNKSSLVRG